MGEVGKALKAFSPSNMKTLIIEEGGEEKAPKWDCSLANIEHLPQTAHRKMAHEETDNTPVEGDTGLVDSGATHALRSGTEAEMQKAINVPEGTVAQIQTRWSWTKALAPLPLMTFQTSQSCLGRREVRSQKRIQERQMKDQAIRRMI